MKTYEELNAEWHKIYDAIHHYNKELYCLPKCDYSYKTEKELEERYNKKLEELYAKLANIEKQQEELQEV